MTSISSTPGGNRFISVPEQQDSRFLTVPQDKGKARADEMPPASNSSSPLLRAKAMRKKAEISTAPSYQQPPTTSNNLRTLLLNLRPEASSAPSFFVSDEDQKSKEYRALKRFDGRVHTAAARLGITAIPENRRALENLEQKAVKWFGVEKINTFRQSQSKGLAGKAIENMNIRTDPAKQSLEELAVQHFWAPTYEENDADATKTVAALGLQILDQAKLYRKWAKDCESIKKTQELHKGNVEKARADCVGTYPPPDKFFLAFMDCYLAQSPT